MKLKIETYNRPDSDQKESVMPKRKIEPPESFGTKLATLRKAAGYSQRELATEIGISNRMVAYYEKQTQHPPTNLMPLLTKALGVSADQLLGLEKTRESGRRRDTKLWRRFSQVEKLPSPQKKQIAQILDTFLEREKLRRAV